jgi:hypothetical protein
LELFLIYVSKVCKKHKKFFVHSSGNKNKKQEKRLSINSTDTESAVTSGPRNFNFQLDIGSREDKCQIKQKTEQQIFGGHGWCQVSKSYPNESSMMR